MLNDDTLGSGIVIGTRPEGQIVELQTFLGFGPNFERGIQALEVVSPLILLPFGYASFIER